MATQFYSNEHGSLENYLILTSGQYLTHNNDTLAVFNVDNIERHLLTNGMTFKSYAQTLPFAGYTGLYSGAYMKRHAPLPYYTDMANSSLIKNHVSLYGTGQRHRQWHAAELRLHHPGRQQ